MLLACNYILQNIGAYYAEHNTVSANHDQWDIQEILAYNWLLPKPRKEMNGKHIWHELHEDKHNCTNQNKAWSHWHITLTFFSDTCKPCFFVCFVLGGFFVLFFGVTLNNGNKVQSQFSDLACQTDVYVHSPLLSVISKSTVYDNDTKYPKVHTEERG